MSENIRCPKCEWKPSADSTWRCHCGHEWNTFDTAGQCPSCRKQWENTQCLAWSCLKMSPHVDWYEGLDKLVEELIESIEIQVVQ